MRWTVVIPAKALPGAKSRLAADPNLVEVHPDLVQAIRADTIRAAHAALGVARILIVTDRAEPTSAPSGAPFPASGVLVMVQRSPGLNGALADAAARAAQEWPVDGLAALVGDLPALRPEELDEALAAAVAAERGFVRDAAGTGTTLLTALPAVALRPAFGNASASRHQDSGAAELPAGAGLRCDVDTAEDLRAALALGAGPDTEALSAAVAPLGGTGGRLPESTDSSCRIHLDSA